MQNRYFYITEVFKHLSPNPHHNLIINYNRLMMGTKILNPQTGEMSSIIPMRIF